MLKKYAAGTIEAEKEVGQKDRRMLSLFDGRLRLGFPRNDSPVANHETGK